MYLGALALVAACSSSNVNSNPFEQATQNPHFDAGGPPPAPANSAGSSSGAPIGGNDMKGAAGSCTSDAECGNGCNGSTPCCCDVQSQTCFSPESGACGSGGGGSDATTGDDGSSSGDDSGGMQMMP
jgi:hypothetical protein